MVLDVEATSARTVESRIATEPAIHLAPAVVTRNGKGSPTGFAPKLQLHRLVLDGRGHAGTADLQPPTTSLNRNGLDRRAPVKPA